MKAKLPESRAAVALLGSDRPFRAEVRCVKERHGLGRVYLLQMAGSRRPEGAHAAGRLDAAVEPGDNRELIFVPWVYRLGDECPDPDDAILFRCWCRMYTATSRRLTEKLRSLRPDDDWLIVGIAVRRAGSHTGAVAPANLLERSCAPRAGTAELGSRGRPLEEGRHSMPSVVARFRT